MSLILPEKWAATEAEQRGFVTSQHGILEAGWDGPASMLRKDQAGQLVHELAKLLHAIHGKMGDLSWNDDEVQICIGVQARNKWVQVEGIWFEVGSPEYLRRIAEKAVKREI